MHERTLTDVCYHEAAHAVVGEIGGLNITSLTTGADGPYLRGRCYVEVYPEDRVTWERTARMDLAGSVCDWTRSPTSRSMTVSEHDFARYIELRNRAGWPYGYVNELANETAAILLAHWGRVEALAAALIEEGTLSGAQAREAMARSEVNEYEYRVARAINSAEVFAAIGSSESVAA